MRLALAAVALVVAVGPGWAEEATPSDAEKAVISIAVVADYLEQNCPHYQIDKLQFNKFSAFLHVDPDKVVAEHNEYLRSRLMILQNRTDRNKDEFCNYFANYFGPQGELPNFVIHK